MRAQPGWFWFFGPLLALAAAGALLALPGPAGTRNSAGGRVGAPSPTRAEAAPAPRIDRPSETQPNRFFEPASFDPGLRAVTAVGLPPVGPGRLVGGVAPHHALAGSNLSRFFLRLEAEPPQTLIVVGPNHPERGQRVITGRRGWATDFGVVETEAPLVDALVKAGLATVDEETLAEEHSVGALMPYLKYHAPKTRVVPLILHKDITLAELQRLAEVLAPAVNENRILVASVDFSHYLTRREAQAKDEQTWAAIESADLQELLRMGPDHLDCPPALVLVMLTMERLGAEGPVVEAHTNSGILLASDTIETTSYFTLTYRIR
jgi:MEMO1 family protein